MLKWIGGALGALLGLDSLPWADDVWNEFVIEPTVTMTPLDPTYYGLDPRTDPFIVQVIAGNLSIKYVRSMAGKEVRESLDISLKSKTLRGGMIVRYTDGSPISWNRPTASHAYPVLAEERLAYAKLINRMRELTKQ